MTKETISCAECAEDITIESSLACTYCGSSLCANCFADHEAQCNEDEDDENARPSCPY